MDEWRKCSGPIGYQLLKRLLTFPNSQHFELLQKGMLVAITPGPLPQTLYSCHVVPCVCVCVCVYTPNDRVNQPQGSLQVRRKVVYSNSEFVSTLYFQAHHLSAQPPTKSPFSYLTGSRQALELQLRPMSRIYPRALLRGPAPGESGVLGPRRRVRRNTEGA